MRAPGRQQSSLEKSSGWEMGVSVFLGRKSPITNTFMCFSGHTGSNVGRWLGQLGMVAFVLAPVRYSRALQSPNQEHPVCYVGALQEMGEGSSFYPEHRNASGLLHLRSHLCQSPRGYILAYLPFGHSEGRPSLSLGQPTIPGIELLSVYLDSLLPVNLLF